MKEIPLTKGMVTIVDDADYLWLIKYKWHIKAAKYDNYAQCWAKGAGRENLMHRMIMQPNDGQVVHHKNSWPILHPTEPLPAGCCNTLNNLRENLEVCTQKQNLLWGANYGKKQTVY